MKKVTFFKKTVETFADIVNDVQQITHIKIGNFYEQI
jgi:hypothetical protein